MATRVDISTSLDGYVAGPNVGPDHPLGEGGERLHDWAVGSASWRESHGLEGGETGRDADVVEEGIARTGATVMGRGMFGGGPGPWGDQPWEGWWGDEPPFHHSVFVLTHHAREPLEKEGTTFTFVTDGIAAAVEQAAAAAGDKDVLVAGGADAIQQALAARLVDEIQLHVAPLLLGGGIRLFDQLGPELVELEPTRVIGSDAVTHLKYAIKGGTP